MTSASSPAASESEPITAPVVTEIIEVIPGHFVTLINGKPVAAN